MKRLKERTENYQVNGFRLLWLMGEILCLKDQIPNLQKNLVYFSENKVFYDWDLDFKSQKFLLKILILESWIGKIIYLKKKFLFGKGQLMVK